MLYAQCTDSLLCVLHALSFVPLRYSRLKIFAALHQQDASVANLQVHEAMQYAEAKRLEASEAQNSAFSLKKTKASIEQAINDTSELPPDQKRKAIQVISTALCNVTQRVTWAKQRAAHAYNYNYIHISHDLLYLRCVTPQICRD